MEIKEVLENSSETETNEKKIQMLNVRYTRVGYEPRKKVFMRRKIFVARIFIKNNVQKSP